MTGITGIYMSRQYARGEDNVIIRIEGENMNCVFTVSNECLLTALRNDLNMEVKE